MKEYTEDDMIKFALFYAVEILTREEGDTMPLAKKELKSWKKVENWNKILNQ